MIDSAPAARSQGHLSGEAFKASEPALCSQDRLVTLNEEN